jgi:NADPH-dependent 2,4-dienoyl-CoA reductase/sulfur reductase-like enzyme
MVAGYSAKEFVERSLKPGELTIVSDDTSLPYERPPLSKGFLAGKETDSGIRINPDNFYREHEIEARLSCEVDGIDASRRLLHLRSGEDLGFEKLIIATGAHVKTLDVPGANLPGVHYLRSLEDSKRIRTHAESAKRAVVIGGGFIAMEVASVLAQKGIATTMVLREERIWKQFFTPEVSRFFETYYSQRGVEFIKQAKVAKLQGGGAVTSVALEENRTVECDLVVAGIGVHPVTEPIANSGIVPRDQPA